MKCMEIYYEGKLFIYLFIHSNHENLQLFTLILYWIWAGKSLSGQHCRKRCSVEEAF